MPIEVFQLPKTVFYVAGASVLGPKIPNVTDLIEQLEGGLEAIVVTHLAKHMSLSIENLLMFLGISNRSFKTALENKKRLSRSTSERLYRSGRIMERAVEVFQGDKQKALRWLTTPKLGLGNELPLRFVRTEVGGECVLELLEELIDGGVA